MQKYMIHDVIYCYLFAFLLASYSNICSNNGLVLNMTGSLYDEMSVSGETIWLVVSESSASVLIFSR